MRTLTLVPNASRARIASFCAASVPSISSVGSVSAYPSRCASARTLGVRPLSREHLGEDEIAGPVENRLNSGNLIRRQRLVDASDDGNSAGNGGLESDCSPERAGLVEKHIAVLAQEGLIRRDDVLPAFQQGQKDFPCRFESAHQLGGGIDLRIANNGLHVVREHPFGQLERSGLLDVADNDFPQFDRSTGPSRHEVRLVKQNPAPLRYQRFPNPRGRRVRVSSCSAQFNRFVHRLFR